MKIEIDAKEKRNPARTSFLNRSRLLGFQWLEGQQSKFVDNTQTFTSHFMKCHSTNEVELRAYQMR